MDADARALTHIESLLRVRQSAGAEIFARELTARSDNAEGHILLGRALQQQGRLQEALQAADAALRIRGHPAATLLAIECRLQTDEYERGLRELRGLERDAIGHPRLLQDVGNLYVHLNLHVDAERCYARAAALAPDDPQALYNWATCLTALGQLEKAEQLLDRVITLAPDDHDAYYNRSTLRRQTAERNHLGELSPGLCPCQGIGGSAASSRIFRHTEGCR
jgi:tetratricopeptide (TPR) repeat protein